MDNKFLGRGVPAVSVESVIESRLNVFSVSGGGSFLRNGIKEVSPGQYFSLGKDRDEVIIHAERAANARVDSQHQIRCAIAMDLNEANFTAIKGTVYGLTHSAKGELEWYAVRDYGELTRDTFMRQGLREKESNVAVKYFQFSIDLSRFTDGDLDDLDCSVGFSTNSEGSFEYRTWKEWREWRESERLRELSLGENRR